MRGEKGLCGKCNTAQWKKTPRGKAVLAQNRVKHAAEINAKLRAKRAASPGSHSENVKAYHRRLRANIIEAYGSRCACCGETEPVFLQLDHVFGGGIKHLKLVGSWVGVYREVRDLGYPKDLFRLLCANCNSAISRRGTCPHEVARMVDALLVAV